jgi:glycosyltransferase involved in cell wall biosynthesis
MPIRIALQIYKLEVGGAEKVICALANCLDKTYFSPVVISFKKGQLLDEINNDIPVIILNKKSKIDIRFFWRLLKIFKKYQFDLIHSHTLSPNLWGAILGNIFKIPSISTEHTISQNKNSVKILIWKLIFRLNQRTVFVSESVKKTYTIPSLLKKKTKIVYNGISVPKNRRKIENQTKQKKQMFNIEEDDTILCTIGRLEPPKGHIYLIYALKKLLNEHKNIKCIFVGDGSLRDKLENEAFELGVLKNIIFTGIRSDVPDILRFCDVIVIPSIREGFSLALLEAMAAGKPIIATNVGGNKEAIEHRKSGLIVEPRDVKGLSEGISFLLKNSKVASEFGYNARLKYSNGFTNTIMIQKYQDLYFELLNI